MNTSGINLFANRKVSSLFYKIIMKMNVYDKQLFTANVKKLFEEKSVSEEGQFSSFKIETFDLERILVDMKISPLSILNKI